VAASKTPKPLQPYQVVIRPLVTEKGFHKAERLNQYAFEVCAAADKETIRNAIEHLFEVKVLRVNTQTRKGKPRRTKNRVGQTKAWKKAIVTLHPEHRINFF
jgi:large subunit ribosomal protein L23